MKNVSYQVLEIENFDERQFTLPLGGADFYSLDRKQAPASLKAITTDEYWYGSSFHTTCWPGWPNWERLRHRQKHNSTTGRVRPLG